MYKSPLITLGCNEFKSKIKCFINALIIKDVQQVDRRACELNLNCKCKMFIITLKAKPGFSDTYNRIHSYIATLLHYEDLRDQTRPMATDSRRTN